MSVVGTIVANVVANIDKFESGMKKAASIHQSTVKQISSGQMLNGYRNADDWWKGITSAQRSSNSQYASELESALEGTQRRIAASGMRTGQSLAKGISDGLVSGLSGKAGGLSGLSQKIDGLLDNVAVRAAGKIGLILKAADMFVEGDNAFKKNQFLNNNGKALADLVFQRDMRAAKTPEMLNNAGTLTQQLKEQGFSTKGFSAIYERERNLSARLKETAEAMTEAELANVAFEKATGQKGSAFKSIQEAKLAIQGFNVGVIDTARAATAGGLSAIPFIGQGLGGMVMPEMKTNFDIELELNKFNEFLKEGQKQVVEIKKNAKQLADAANVALLKSSLSGLASAANKSLAENIKPLSGVLGKSVLSIENRLFPAINAAERNISLFQKSIEGQLETNRIKEQFSPSFALGQELQRIDAEKSKGFLDDQTANVMRSAARQRFASQLGSGFNQTRLFGAMEQGSAAAVSAINEAQNRRKSPEEMALNEQLEEAKRQTKLLEKIGERTVIEAKAAGFN
jgi:hypothetical protein